MRERQSLPQSLQMYLAGRRHTTAGFSENIVVVSTETSYQSLEAFIIQYVIERWLKLE